MKGQHRKLYQEINQLKIDNQRMLQEKAKVIENPKATKADENFVADKWSMANRAPTPEEMLSSTERKNKSKLNKKKLGLGGF